MADESATPDIASQIAAVLASEPSGKTLLMNPWLDELATIWAFDKSSWASIAKVLRDLRLLRVIEAPVKDRAQKNAKVKAISAPVGSTKFVSDIWGDAVEQKVATEHAIVPHGYGLDGPLYAIYRINKIVKDGMVFEDPVAVSYDPIVISRRIQHMDRKSQMLELSWKRGKRWHRETFPADTVFTKNAFAKTSGQGVPVGDDNAAELSKFLRAYEHENLANIMLGYATSSMGWQAGEEDATAHGFMCGTKQIGGNGKAIELVVGEGDERSANDIAGKGSMQGWLEAIAPLERWPTIRVAIYAALAAPLLAILEAPNAIIEWCGETTRGKSTALLWGGSCWRSLKLRLPTWNTTIVGLEAKAQVLNDMPLIIDDTAEVPEHRRAELLTAAVYMLESGHAKTRGNKDLGQRASKTWRTVVMSSGEYTLSEYAGTGGAAARVLTFWGAPLGEDSDDPAVTAANDAAIAQVKEGLARNYGVAGPAFVKWLCEHRDAWDTLRADYERDIARLKKQDRTPAAIRLAPTIALLECTARIAKLVLGVPWTNWSVMDDPVIRAAITSAVAHATIESNKARQAWEQVVSYAASRRDQWIVWGRDPKEGQEPASGWLGWRRVRSASREIPGMPSDALPDADLLAWHPHQLKRVLTTEVKAPVNATLRAWRDKGVLLTAHGRMTATPRCSGDGAPERVLLLKASNTIWDDDNR
jgi:putative DNA primase/helicase